MKDLGDVSWYLGMEINRLKDGSIILTQKKYIEDVLKRHGMDTCSARATPMIQKAMNKAPESYTADKDLRQEYHKLLGELMHPMVQTRPDIAYAVSRLAEFTSNPTEDHWEALKRVLRYLKGTSDVGICYSRSLGALILSVWTDSSWGEDPDDAKSTNGYVILMGGGPVTWKSQKQKSVALSSTEAEYYGQSMAATGVMWTRGLMKELQIQGAIPKDATVMYADNQGAIKLANNPIFQKRSKHIAIKYHYTRDLIKEGELTLEYRSTQEMIADGLTKPLGTTKFAQFVKMLGLTSMEKENKNEA